MDGSTDRRSDGGWTPGRGDRSWAGRLWLLAAALAVPLAFVLPVWRLAHVRVTARRPRTFYSN